MKRVVLGVVGHVDHGKTALVRALTGMETDRLAEERERGISIALGFAHCTTADDCTIDLIDMPGHERFVHTMVAGATGIDAVLLVVAANEGIKPQTIEHIDIAGLLGLRRAVVAVSKADLVPPDEAHLVAEEAVELLSRAGITALPPVLTSATANAGIEELRRALSRLADEQVPRRADGIAFLPIDRAFSLPGHGPIVTGTLRGGRIHSGETLELFPLRRKVRLRALQQHGRRVESAGPGQRVAANLRDVGIGELHRGMALASPAALTPGEWLTLTLRTTTDAPPLRNGKLLRALFGTQEIEVRLRLLNRDEIGPGESGFAQLRCAEPVALPAREHVIMRIASPARTVGGGRLLECGARRLKRLCPDVAWLQLLAEGTPEQIAAAEVEREAANGVSIARLSALTALAPARLADRLERLPVVVTSSGMVLPKAQIDRLQAQVPALLALHPPGLTGEKLASALPGVGQAALDLAVQCLLADGAIAKRDSRYLIPREEDDRARMRDETALAQHIAATLRHGGLTPPRPAEIVTDAASRRAVDRLIREGTVVKAVDRAKHKEILFHQDAVEQAQARLQPLLARGPGLLVTEICAELAISRKFAMPLLDHLDTIRFTRRIGDRRLLNVAVAAPR